MIDIVCITYFLVGLLTVIVVVIHDMRGEEFDPRFFDMETVFASIILLSSGYMAPILVWIACGLSKPRERKHRITRLLHKLSNIGIKKDLD